MLFAGHWQLFSEATLRRVCTRHLPAKLGPAACRKANVTLKENPDSAARRKSKTAVRRLSFLRLPLVSNPATHYTAGRLAAIWVRAPSNRVPF